MNKAYMICLNCGNVQARTDILNELGDKQYTLLNRKIMCPKCHKMPQFAATKDIKKLKLALNSSSNKLDNKLNNMIG